MKNTKRSVSFILCITQIVICVLVMVTLSYELYAFGDGGTGEYGLWWRILMAIAENDSTVATTLGIIILAVFNISLVISALSLVFVIKWDSANSLAGLGIASIFLFNFGAGIAMVLGAHQLSSRYDSKKRLGSIFSVAQICVAILVMLLSFLAVRAVKRSELTEEQILGAFIAIMILMVVSITMATLSLVSITSCRNPRAMLAIGVLSIFLLNLGAGIMLISKAPEAEALLRAQAAK